MASRLIIFATIVGCYFLLGLAGLQLATLNQNTSPIWMASGFAVGALLIMGPGYAGAIFLGAFLTNMTVDTPTIGLILVSFGNMMEALVGHYLFLWIARQSFLKSYSDFFSITFGAMFSSLISPTIGVTTLFYLGIVPQNVLSYTWFTWWSGDCIGILLMLPFILEFKESQYSEFSWKKVSAAVILTGITYLSIYAVFVKNANQAYAWILCPMFIITGVLLGKLASRTLLIFSAVLVLYFTSKGHSLYEIGELNQNLIYAQCLLFSYAFSVLFVKPFISHKQIGSKFILGNLLGWATIFMLIYFISSHEKKHILDELHNSVDLAFASVQRSVQKHELLLSTSEALIKSKSNLTQHDWNHYVASIQKDHEFRAMTGMGLIQVVKKKEVKRFELKQRTESHHDFKIKIINPEYSKLFDEHYVLTFIAPQSTNKNAIGLDVGSEITRRKTLADSLKDNETKSTGPIQLIQDNQSRPGFGIVHPIRDDKQNLLGWTQAAFITSKFFASSLSDFSRYLKISVTSEGADVFRLNSDDPGTNRNTSFLIKKELNIFGRPHTFEFYPQALFLKKNSFSLAALGMLTTLFMLFMTSFLLEQFTFNQKTEALIKERTKELELSKIQLFHSSKMATLGEMASGMAHEINNPLTIIFGKIAVIKEMLKEHEMSNPPLIEEIQKINATTLRIARIVKSLRSFSRSSKDDPFETAQLEKVIHETLDLCFERFKAAGIPLIIERIPNVSIICRPGQISQVLLNLLNNAHDAIEELEEKWIQIGFTIDNNDRILIHVTDSGKGIPPEIASKITEPFFTTKDVQKGTGLGLSIVKGIMDEHGGQFLLDSNHPNTKFTVDLKIQTV